VRGLRHTQEPAHAEPSYQVDRPRRPPHSKKQIRQIADSIRTFGWTNPVLIDAEGGIIAGHGRVEAAKLLGLDQVPTLLIDHLSEAQKRAYILADNKLAENAGWDLEILALELQSLCDLELDFDLEVTGFETAEIDLVIESLEGGEDDPAADALPEHDPDAAPVSRLGDLWRLGEHRLLCGDATKAEALDRLLDAEVADMVFVDPPYNVAIEGNVSGLGSVRHRDFAMASGEMSETEFTDFLITALTNLAEHSADGSIHFVCMDWRHMAELLAAGRVAYGELKNLCIWNKTNGGMGTFYRSKHELVFVYKNGTAPHINTFELGQYGRSRTNVWDYAGVNTLRAQRLEELHMHPTVKPVALIADAIKDCSRRGGLILDSFAGSGSTIIAAEKTGRRAYALELDPGYVDTAVRRWQSYTGQAAVHNETGATFDEVMAARGQELEAEPKETETADV
jgi:DNA modification methylase